MKNSLDSHEQDEITSQKTVKFWLSKGEGGYIGEVYIDNGQFVVVGGTTEDTVWLDRKLSSVWRPQMGIPTFKKIGGEFARGEDNRYIRDTYLNHGNCTADELLEALYDYCRAFGGFVLEFENRKV